LVAASVRRFVNQYGRKAQKGIEPNDRRYDRKVERAVKRMKPDQLDKLLRDDEA
jgi:ribosomal protein S18